MDVMQAYMIYHKLRPCLSLKVHHDVGTLAGSSALLDDQKLPMGGRSHPDGQLGPNVLLLKLFTSTQD